MKKKKGDKKHFLNEGQQGHYLLNQKAERMQHPYESVREKICNTITVLLIKKKNKFLLIFQHCFKKSWIYTIHIWKIIKKKFTHVIKSLYELLFYVLLYIFIDHLWGLNFKTGWLDSHLKLRNRIKKNHEGGRLPPWKIFVFSEIFALMKWNSPFQKNSTIFVQRWFVVFMFMVICYCQSKAFQF